MSYRPITDLWLLTRSRVNYYGAYPFGFLERARNLLGVAMDDPVLHVCSGKLRSYPYRGLGPNDKLVDADPSMHPDFMCDVRKELPKGDWAAILADPPYTPEDAAHYGPGAHVFPEPNALLKRCLESVRPGGRVGVLHYYAPRPPKTIDGRPVKLTALVAVMTGYKNRVRCFSVFEHTNGKQTIEP